MKKTARLTILLTILIAVIPIVQLFSQDTSSGLKIQIIGSGGPGINPSRAEPSVLVSSSEAKILVDMGNGTQANLAKAGIKLNELTALFITHHHIDHNQEFMPILTGMLLGRKIPYVIGPSGTRTITEFATSFWAQDIAYRRSNIGTQGPVPVPEVKEVKGGESFTLQGLSIETAAVVHSIETIAYRFELGGKSIVVSGDLTYSPNLPVLARDCDILILDAGSSPAGGTARGKAKQPGETPAHASFDEIVRMVKAANPETLVLTHLSMRPFDEDTTRAAFITEGIKCKLVFAADLMEFSL